MGKLWIGSAVSPYGNPFGFLAVVADTREEAIEKAGAYLDEQGPASYVPAENYRQNLLDHLDQIEEVEGGVAVDWQTPL